MSQELLNRGFAYFFVCDPQNCQTNNLEKGNSYDTAKPLKQGFQTQFTWGPLEAESI